MSVGRLGRLPYAYVEEKLGVELWVLLHPGWINSGEFYVPGLLQWRATATRALSRHVPAHA